MTQPVIYKYFLKQSVWRAQGTACMEHMTAFKRDADCTEVPLMSVVADSTSRQPICTQW